MPRGTIAKDKVTQKIKQAFGEDFVGEQDKKLYVWANDGGERVQIAISLTCPKTFIESNGGGDFDFSDDAEPANAAVSTGTAFTPAEITKEETETLQELLKKFGLN